MRLRFRLRRVTALSGATLAFVAVAVSCQEPTQITVRITTTERCANLSPVHTVVGPSPLETQTRFERKYSSAETEDCDDSHGVVGTLVLTPGDGPGGSVLVAVGVRTDGQDAPDALTCGDPEVAKRCIIARRTFSFVETKPLTLPINLDPLCIGRACDPASTCFKGSCVNAEIVCNDASCGLAEEIGGGDGGGGDTGIGEGGVTEASSSDGAYDAEIDGAGNDSGDSSPPTDAMAEGGVDGGPYPLCAQSGMIYYCSPPTMGTSSAGNCPGGDPMGIYCCRCTCPSSGQVSSCSSMAMNGACSSLSPACLSTAGNDGGP